MLLTHGQAFSSVRKLISALMHRWLSLMLLLSHDAWTMPWTTTAIYWFWRPVRPQPSTAHRSLMRHVAYHCPARTTASELHWCVAHASLLHSVTTRDFPAQPLTLRAVIARFRMDGAMTEAKVPSTTDAHWAQTVQTVAIATSHIHRPLLKALRRHLHHPSSPLRSTFRA